MSLKEFQIKYLPSFYLFLVIDRFEWFWGGLQGSILGPALILVHINDLPDEVMCNIAISADDYTLYSECDLLQQLKLAPELGSDLPDSVDWGRKQFVDFNAGKTQVVSFDLSENGWVCS